VAGSPGGGHDAGQRDRPDPIPTEVSLVSDRQRDDALASARLLVAYVSEDDELDHVRDAALALGRRGARVILYDRDSASALSDPMPNQWGSQAEGAQFGDPLSDQDLVKLGREPFARKVAAARQAGVDAWGWLASDHGTDAVVDYARDHGADLVLLPADLEHPGLGERLKGETVEGAVAEAEEAAASLAVLLVAPDGSTELAADRR
jgi:nucleotide-binding universal stress UspA family protein